MKRKKCLFLIPTKYNNGEEVPHDIIVDILDCIYLEFNGYSIDGITEGTWRMSDGKKAVDHSLKIWIVLEEEKITILKKLIKMFAKTLKQEAIYLEFIEP